MKLNRGKVTDAYNEISNEKIKTIKGLEQMQHKYETLLAMKNKEIEELKEELDRKDSESHRLTLELQGKSKAIK